MAKITVSAKPLAVNPLKVSQPVGASLAFLGLARTMPLEHGARGCTSFNKLFFMRHFREPIPLQTTAMDQVVTIVGADANVVEALHTVAQKNAPEIVGLITTGLSETQGTDIVGTIKLFRRTYPEHDGMAIVPVGATDTLGSLETGFALAVQAIITHLVPEGRRAEPPLRQRSTQVNLLASPMLTPGDIEAVKEWIVAFGLTPLVIPDIADSLDGHMIEAGFSTLTYGGTPRASIALAGESRATLVIGPSLRRAADLLQGRTGVPDYRFDGLMGLADCDAFIHALSQISGRPVPAAIERQRAQLQDAMVDCHFYLSGVPVAIAADADLLGMLTRFLLDMGAQIVAAVASSNSPALQKLPIEEVLIGDLEDMENLARLHRAQLLVANSHGAEAAARLDLPLLRAGFPLYDMVGGHARIWVGYRGSRQTLFDICNLLLGRRREIAPYRSLYWEGTPRAAETAGAAAPCIV